MFNIKNLISPLTGLSMVRAAIQKELGFKIPVYTIEYIANPKSIKFHIPVDGKVRVYPYDQSDKLCAIIDNLVKSELKTGDIIDVVKVNHENDRANVDIFYRNNKGEKLHLNNKI